LTTEAELQSSRHWQGMSTGSGSIHRGWREDNLSTGGWKISLGHWIQSSTTQHWSGNHLSSSAESTSLKHAHRNGSVQHRTDRTMMMMIPCLSQEHSWLFHYRLTRGMTTARQWTPWVHLGQTCSGKLLNMCEVAQHAWSEDWTESLTRADMQFLTSRIMNDNTTTPLNCKPYPTIPTNIETVLYRSIVLQVCFHGTSMIAAQMFLSIVCVHTLFIAEVSHTSSLLSQS